MTNLGPDNLDHLNRFLFDNIIDGVREGTLVMWQAFDTVEHREVWVLGRKVPPDKVMPVATLVSSPADAVKRYAPAKGLKDYDFSQIESQIIRP